MAKVNVTTGYLDCFSKKALQINIFNITYDYVNYLEEKIFKGFIATVDFWGVLNF